MKTVNLLLGSHLVFYRLEFLVGSFIGCLHHPSISSPFSFNPLSYLKFLDDLLHLGEVKLESEMAPTDDERCQANELLTDFELTWRMDLPTTLPAYSPKAGNWAATMFFRAAQLLMFRDIPEEEVKRSLSEATPPDDQSPENHYSVDLVFRFLPDLANYSQSLAADDPLSCQLQRWCRQWPMSSVGVRSWRSPSADQTPNDDDTTVPRLSRR